MKAPPANVRYYDPSFLEKRVWVARLLTHFLMQLEATVIISIDESNFRSRVGSEYRWGYDHRKVLKRVRRSFRQQ